MRSRYTVKQISETFSRRNSNFINFKGTNFNNTPLAFFRWFLPRPRIGMMSLVTVFPVITAFHSCCLSHHVFDQVNLWPAWVGFETAIFWQRSPGIVETQRLYPLRPEGRSRMDFFGLINPYLVFQSRIRTESVPIFFLYLSLIGIILWKKKKKKKKRKTTKMRTKSPQ